MSGDDRPTMPPVRLPSEAELARDALAAPLFTRAVRLARWTGTSIRVGAGGELLGDQLKAAAVHLGLDTGEDGLSQASESWNLAVDTGLLEIDEDEGAEPTLETDEAVGTATPGEELELLTSGGPADVLEIWQAGLEALLADAATPSFEDLLGGIEGALGEDGQIDPESIDLDALEWNPEEEADFLDSALGNLYLLTATDAAVSTGAMVPLPVLAASMIIPEDMDEPTDEVLEEVSAAMMRLDEQFRLLEPIGLVEYRPVDEALIEEATGDGTDRERDEREEQSDQDAEVSRYGMVRLTPLGLYGVRGRMREAGVEAPAVGDLADADAAALLAALPGHTEDAAQAELEQWLDKREPQDAARALLAAAKGTDAGAPRRRLLCQQALSLIGADAEPALREVLDDGELGGLARVWLAERGVAEVPPPGEEMVFWLTVDTLAAQLDAEGGAAASPELVELVRGLVDQHAGFFTKAWRVDHPATADVLTAMGHAHPDPKVAKEARKAAYKARSRG